MNLKIIVNILEQCNIALNDIALIEKYESLTEEHIQERKVINNIIEACKQSPSYEQASLMLNNDFEIVTSDWIREMLEITDTSKTELAEGVNVGSPQISNWLSNRQNPTGSAKAAILYFFKRKITEKDSFWSV